VDGLSLISVRTNPKQDAHHFVAVDSPYVLILGWSLI
jgi:hypothetical protein